MISLTIALALIGVNYYVIRRKGEVRLKRIIAEESSFVKWALDFIMVCYVILVFVFINYTRSLHVS